MTNFEKFKAEMTVEDYFRLTGFGADEDDADCTVCPSEQCPRNENTIGKTCMEVMKEWLSQEANDCAACGSKDTCNTQKVCGKSCGQLAGEWLSQEAE